MRRVAAVLALLALTACEASDFPFGPERATPEDPGEVILDAVHNDGNPHFYWLPPLVDAPSWSGAFDAALAPTVVICQWVDAACEGPALATFTPTSGPGSETVRLSVEDGHYLVNWHTGDFPVVEGATYRIRVVVAGTELGYVDLALYANMGQAKKALTGETIGLVDGRTLPIKFRIEEGAVFVVGPEGGTITAVGGVVTLTVPEGATTEALGITVFPTVDYPDDGTIAPGSVFDFGPDGTVFAEPVQLTIAYDPDQLPPDFAEADLVLGHLVDGVWTEVPGSTVDLDAHTVSGAVVGFSAYGAMEATTPPPDLSAPIIFSSTRTGTAELFTFDGLTLEQITVRGGSSPDWLGHMVAFQHNYDIWTLDLETMTVANLTTSDGVLEFGPVWSPGGTKIAYVRSEPGGQYDVWVINADGSGDPTIITTDPANDAAPAWSPDGLSIAFQSNRTGSYEIYRVDWAGSGATTQLTADPTMENGSPSWSPDGGTVAFARYTPGGEGEIWLMDDDGGNQRALTTAAGTQDYGPAWSPDGSQVAFERTADLPSGTSDIWVANVDGSGLGPVVEDPADDGAVGWQKSIVSGMTVTHQPVATSGAYETTPTLGADAITGLLVYTSRDVLAGGDYDWGEIVVQRLNPDGTAAGSPIVVSDGTTDDKLADVSGSRIAYSAFQSKDSMLGHVMVYDLETQTSVAVPSDATTVHAPAIHGTSVVWTQGQSGTLKVLYHDLSWSGVEPVTIGGPNPPASNVDIGARFVVWEEQVLDATGTYYQGDIVAYDLLSGVPVGVSFDGAVDESQPATSGNYIVWETTAIDGTHSIELAELTDPAAPVFTTIVEGGGNHSYPSIDGDLVAFDSDMAGSYDIYVYRISDGQLFQVTDAPGDEFLNNVYGNRIAYVTSAAGSLDIYVAELAAWPQY